ncbi:MAG: 3-demethylubiquinone-9 3-methyltransferase domain protein [Alphaproteobacteria bacterium]|jgi:predicted 3-demethylubiquinone-9 3-methyltransferase (glyoxalase superfamily)|nr:3-demethylubiquinone-9 3-methyltransferase domain protein [Alphaproteobacteria bacterium]
MIIHQKITPHLWFNANAEEAIDFYVSLFAKSKVVHKLYYGKGDPGPEGTVMGILFELEGQSFGAINGGPIFKLSEAVSLYIGCQTQEEIDRLHAALSKGGEIQPCGWVKDRFGLSWQLNYAKYYDMVSDKDPARARRVIDALFKMKKVDIAALEKAYAGG